MIGVKNFDAKVIPEPNSGCWLWMGAWDQCGYGSFWHEGKCWRVHRLAYEVLVGPIPDDFEIDHLCRTRCCINPAHLEAVSRAENMARIHWPNSAKTHCAQGHLFDEANTYWRPNGKGRQCISCTRERMRRKRGSIRVGSDWRKNETHCIHGHSLSGDNVRVDPKTGKRACRTCHRGWARKRRTQESTMRTLAR